MLGGTDPGKLVYPCSSQFHEFLEVTVVSGGVDPLVTRHCLVALGSAECLQLCG